MFLISNLPLNLDTFLGLKVWKYQCVDGCQANHRCSYCHNMPQHWISL